MSEKILILSVDQDKYDSLVDALSKRPYLKILSMDRDGRKAFSECPCCKKKLSKEQSFTVNEQFVETLVKITEKMSLSKTVILTNKDNPVSLISPLERERCIEVDSNFTFRAVSLGIIKNFVDGMKDTYFVTEYGLSFLSGDSSISPCTMITLDGEVVERHGEIRIEGVKFKDYVKGSSLMRAALHAVQGLPESVRNFVSSGQMSLI